MAYQNYPPSISGGAGTMSDALNRAKALCGTTMVKVFGSEFENDTAYRAAGTAGTGALSRSTTDKGGVITCTSGATANSTIQLFPNGTTTIWIDNPNTTRWYVAAKVKWTTTVDSQATLSLLLSTAASGFPVTRFGLSGGTSTTNLTVSFTNNAGVNQYAATTAVAYDTTSWHLLEEWNDGTNIYFAYDGVTAGSAANTNMGTSAVVPQIFCTNGTTAAARTILCDYIWCSTPNN